MSRSPDEHTFLIEWQRERESVCWLAAQEIVATAKGNVWESVGFYVGSIANSADDFTFVATRLAYWVEHFQNIKRPPLGQISSSASP